VTIRVVTEAAPIPGPISGPCRPKSCFQENRDVGQLFFFLAVVAACLLWSAAFTAAAARSRPGSIRWLLVVVAVIVPVLAVAPWVVITAMMAFQARLETNWFAPTLTTAIAAAVGGGWIARTGLAPRAAPAAAVWPLVGLAAMFVLAKAVAAGTLLFIDNAVAAEGRMLRAEAAQIISTALPPAPSADDNAAPLYQRAFAALAADQEVDELVTADVASDEVTAILERHAATLELLRRATDKPGCRFDRDWSRPSIDTLLPEVQAMRRAAQLLTLAARRAAADGDGDQALADVVRIHRLGMHAASEPILVSGLVGQAIDALAITTLADVLPQLEKSDLPLLEKESLRDFVATPIRFQRAFFGEEAFGLAMLGDLSDAARGTSTVELLRSMPEAPTPMPFDGPLAVLYRCFLLPSDIAGYRAIMQSYQDIAGKMLLPKPQPYQVVGKETAEVEDTLTSRRAGAFASLMAPALSSVLTSQAKGEALHDVAGVLMAATRARLMGKPIAESLVPDAVPALPGDRFTADKPLLAKQADDGWVVYSVGPDGEDDGGPVPAGAEPVEGNDDVGLRLAF
jgi:hypothetical protein